MDYLNRRLAPFPDQPADDGAAVPVDAQVRRIVVRQDLAAACAGTDGMRYQLFANESIVLKVEEP